MSELAKEREEGREGGREGGREDVPSILKSEEQICG